MATLSLRQKTLLLLLCTALAAPLASASPTWKPVAAPAASSRPLGLLRHAWSFLENLWNEEGCMIDPSGRCRTTTIQVSPPSPSTDSGCMIDPDGRCHT